MSVTLHTGLWARKYIEQGDLQLQLAEGSVVADALAELVIPPDEIGIILINGKAVSRSTALVDGDILEVLPLIIGG